MMCLRYESTTIYCGRTSQEVRELKFPVPDALRDAQRRTSQEVRELKSELVSRIEAGDLVSHLARGA